MKNFGENPRDFAAPTTQTETTTASSMEAAIDDWDKPFTSEELEAIEAAFAAAEAALSPSSSSSFKTTRRISSSGDDDADGRPRTRRRLPGSITYSDGEVGSGQKSGPFALLPCSSSRPLHYGKLLPSCKPEFLFLFLSCCFHLIAALVVELVFELIMSDIGLGYLQ